MTAITPFYSPKTMGISYRKSSYDFLRNFSRDKHDWASGRAPDSDQFVLELSGELQKLNDNQLSFLLCHTGFIPEDYAHDSSEETIYTKLVEIVVAEWARRAGFEKTVLPKQKSSYEDVTISDGKNLIVCDAKSFRLGRSQKAPNVKDALKEGDIPKWLSNHKVKGENPLGGLITFPSQHDWSSGSDFYFYLTNKDQPIVCLFYEHLAFMLLKGIGRDKLVELYSKYEDLFPNQIGKRSGNRDKYWKKIEEFLFEDFRADWDDFQEVAKNIIGEKVFFTIKTIEDHIEDLKEKAKKEIPEAASIDELRTLLAEARTERSSFTFVRQLECIKNFRHSLKDFLLD